MDSTGTAQQTLGILYNNTENDECLLVGLICDEQVNGSIVGEINFNSANNSCSNTTTYTSSYACPVYTVNALVDFVESYAWLFGILAIVGGLLFTFLGLKLFIVCLFLVGLIATVFLILLIFYSTFLQDNTESWVGWLVLVLSAVLGCGVGFLFTKLARFGAAILAAWGGFMLGILINESWLYMYGSSALFWSVNVISAIIFFVLGFLVFNQAIMVSTAFLGSYFICRGISFWAGGFPPAYQLVEQVQSNAIDFINPAFYGYLAGILVLTILGAVVQFKMYYKKMEQEKHPYDRLRS